MCTAIIVRERVECGCLKLGCDKYQNLEARKIQYWLWNYSTVRLGLRYILLIMVYLGYIWKALWLHFLKLAVLLEYGFATKYFCQQDLSSKNKGVTSMDNLKGLCSCIMKLGWFSGIKLGTICWQVQLQDIDDFYEW